MRLVIILLTISLQAFSQKIEYSLTVPGDTTKNYHIAIYPKTGSFNGLLLLLPGFGEAPEQVMIESDIYKHASDAGLLTIIPSLGDRMFFYIDEASHEKLNQFIEKSFKQYAVGDKPLFIGGHSFGGTMAVRYAQRANADHSNLNKPIGVFAVDPPLDIERLYNCMTTKNRPPKSEVSMQEDAYVSDRIEKVFGRNPKIDPAYFWDVSPYAQSDLEHRALKSLTETPIRIYNEPDINWYINNRSLDFYCINSIDSAAMINWLKSMGNKRAELIISNNKGYRVRQKIRHPHSWSIVDSKELVAWLTEISNN